MKASILGSKNPDNGSIMGWVKSDDIIEHFDEKVFFQPYQRGLVDSGKKKRQLRKKYENDLDITTITVNLVGTTRKTTDGVNIDGELHIIDGRQRIEALVSSGVKGVWVPVQMFVGKTLEQEFELFYEMNRLQTRLSFGDAVRSYPGNTAAVLRNLIASSKRTDMPISPSNKKAGLALQVISPIVCAMYKHGQGDQRTFNRPCGTAEIEAFFWNDADNTSVKKLESSVRKLLVWYNSVFGAYDYKANAYASPFFMAVCHVVINNFMSATPDLSLNFKKFAEKMSVLSKIAAGSIMPQLLKGQGSEHKIEPIYDTIVDFLNKGARYENRLGTIKEELRRAEERRALARKAREEAELKAESAENRAAALTSHVVKSGMLTQFAKSIS